MNTKESNIRKKIKEKDICDIIHRKILWVSKARDTRQIRNDKIRSAFFLVFSCSYFIFNIIDVLTWKAVYVTCKVVLCLSCKVFTVQKMYFTTHEIPYHHKFMGCQKFMNKVILHWVLVWLFLFIETSSPLLRGECEKRIRDCQISRQESRWHFTDENEKINLVL